MAKTRTCSAAEVPRPEPPAGMKPLLFRRLMCVQTLFSACPRPRRARMPLQHAPCSSALICSSELSGSSPPACMQ